MKSKRWGIGRSTSLEEVIVGGCTKALSIWPVSATDPWSCGEPLGPRYSPLLSYLCQVLSHSSEMWPTQTTECKELLTLGRGPIHLSNSHVTKGRGVYRERLPSPNTVYSVVLVQNSAEESGRNSIRVSNRWSSWLCPRHPVGSKANEQEGATERGFCCSPSNSFSWDYDKISHSQNPKTKQNEKMGVNFFTWLNNLLLPPPFPECKLQCCKKVARWFAVSYDTQEENQLLPAL